MFTINEILRATGGKLTQGPGGGRVRSVAIDSRTIKKGEVFMAIKGEIFDGHDFIEDVIKRGVRVIVLHKPVSVTDDKVSVIYVKDTTRALGAIARFHRLRFNIPVIAVTGSAGKTTIKEMMAAVLSRKYKVLKNEGTQNNHIGVPLTLLKLKPYHEMVILECGTNQPGDISYLADVVRPRMAVFTNIGESHLEKLKSTRGVLKEKWGLTSFMTRADTVLLNADDPLLSLHVHKKHPFQTITYGVDHQSTWCACDVHIHQGRTLCFYVAEEAVQLNTCGVHNVYNALGAFICGHFFKVPVADIVRSLKSFKFPEGRGQILRLGTGWLINDSYNANPVSMRTALQTLQDIATFNLRICVLADMLELGPQAAALHRQVGRDVSCSHIDVLITVGPRARLIGLEVLKRNKKIRVFSCEDVESAQQYLAKVFHNGDAVLIKGSRRMRMEQMVDFLLSSPKGGV